MSSIINKILERDILFGELAEESYRCYSEDMPMAALSCLFILSELAIKRLNNVTDGSFSSLIDKSATKGEIKGKELITLRTLRDFRNKLFHEDHYAWVWEINGVAYPFSEDSTKTLIYEMLYEDIFKFVLRTL